MDTCKTCGAHPANSIVCCCESDSIGRWSKKLSESLRKEEYTKEDIELEARAITRDGDRQKEYGHPRDDWERTAKIWSAILGINVTPEQAMLCMVGTKMSRLVHSPHHHDSLVDIIGYTICYDRLDEER